MASGWFNSGKRDLFDGTVDLANDTIKIMLVSPSYIPDPDHDFVTDINANELSGTGYVGGFGGSGRKVLTGKTFSTDTANDLAEFTSDVITWPTINAGVAAYAVLIKEITNDSASRLVAWLDVSPDVTTNGVDLTLIPNAVSGLMQII